DPEKAAAMRESEATANRFHDILFALARDIATSPCREALLSLMGQAELDWFPSYEETEPAFFALLERESALESDWLAGADTGESYLALLEVRGEIARAAGYASYADYAYEEVYGRTYRPEELSGFRRAVREVLVPLYRAIEQELSETDWAETAGGDYTGDRALTMLEPCLEELSDELVEAYTWLRAHNLYNNAPSETRAEGAYTASLPAYGSAFFFQTPVGDIRDFYTTVHEFGHFNNAYWEEPWWSMVFKGIDLAEVHSQGLELLFTAFYPRLFGADADAAELYLIYDTLGSILSGVVVDEFERFAYANEGLTLQELGIGYATILRQYGLADAALQYSENWMGIQHVFTNPCYYISYAVSAAGAFRFWLEGREDYFAAVDDYLRFTALPLRYDFEEAFEAVNLTSPLTGEYIELLAEELCAALGYVLVETPFTDVPLESASAEAIFGVYEAGLMLGRGEDLFVPEGTLTRAEYLTILWRLEDCPAAEPCPFPDVDRGRWYAPAVDWAWSAGMAQGYPDGSFCPDAAVTREEAAVLLFRYLEGVALPENQEVLLAYEDAAEIHPWAREAMVALTWLNLFPAEETLRPRDPLTREAMAVLIWRLTENLIGR
ncbi:MAG: S-layer homology domain-containing protein, partial [bacterium]